MQRSTRREIDKIYPVCCALVDDDAWKRIVAGVSLEKDNRTIEEEFTVYVRRLGLPGFLPELARLERVIVETREMSGPPEVMQHDINPTLHLVEVSWSGLPELIDSGGNMSEGQPERREEKILVWRHPGSEQVIVRPATDEDLLVLKMVAENIRPEDVAREGNLSVGVVDWALDRAVDKGLIIAPRSLIRRDLEHFPKGEGVDGAFFESPFFTVQWHITQACDLHCRHCYDRSRRSPLKLEQGFRILDDLRTFCKSRHVLGQVSFTGGNPLLYSHFFELYQAAVDRGFVTAILGNPTTRKTIEKIMTIQKPVFYQVSLEGLREHNDYIRGEGNFESVLTFLPILRECGITSLVMLTLTRNNMDQVVPLAGKLRDLADSFTFNRLSQVGEAIDLPVPTPEEYRSFLDTYLRATARNPVMGLKDNLINIVCYERGEELFGGCAGYGCSAAFNFIAILPDGEAHACRKFPSLIGNVFSESIAEIYDSEDAKKYRSGTKVCVSCPIRPVCGGCLAVMYGQGLDIFEQRDPYCFMQSPGIPASER